MNGAKRAAALTGIGVIFLILYGLAADWAAKREILANPTSLSRQSGGMSIFTEIKSAVRPDSTVLQRKPFLFETDFAGVDTVFILSPLAPLSPREAKLVSDQVKAGKNLVVSFHDEKTSRNVAPLIAHLGIRTKWEADKNFQNGKTESIESDYNSRFFREGERYEFYAYYRFQGNSGVDCRLSAMLCYVREEQVGLGTVLFFAGLPPFNNGLISKADNKSIAFRVAAWSGTSLIDEYHHFFTEKTMKDLWLDPRFLLPILGFVLGALLYFLFAHTELRSHLKRRSPAEIGRRSYHEFNREILISFFGTKGALENAVKKQALFLKHLFPDQSERIDRTLRQSSGQKDETLKTITRLILLHQNILNRKGRKAP